MHWAAAPKAELKGRTAVGSVARLSSTGLEGSSVVSWCLEVISPIFQVCLWIPVMKRVNSQGDVFREWCVDLKEFPFKARKGSK